MQSSSSVPVLILVLCCVASAHKAIHLQGRQICNLPDDTPPRCASAVSDLVINLISNSNSTLLNPILDIICSRTCSGSVGQYIDCSQGDDDAYEFLCLQQNSGYCYTITLDRFSSCLLPNCATECSNNCRSCLDGYTNDISCCQMQYQRFPSYDDNSTITTDVCRNTYDTCSGGAIAVPTVLTALLLMVMAAIVM